MSPPARTPLQVAILAFDEVEALDLAGPYEVFTTASRMQQREAPKAPPPFEVHCVARLAGMALAERTARQMEFTWTRA